MGQAAPSFIESRRLILLKALECFIGSAHKRPQFSTHRDRFSRVQAALQRILIAEWRAGTRGSAMHTAAALAGDRRCSTGRATARFCSAARALMHAPRIARTTAQHLGLSCSRLLSRPRRTSEL